MEILGKKIVGLKFADGFHYKWGDEEVAIVDEYRREIQWLKHIAHFPQEVIDYIRNSMPSADGVWTFEVRRNRVSVTQGYIGIYVNGRNMGMSFEDKIELVNGEWESVIPDNELGEFVYASLWHPHDNAYHFSDRFKDIFKPGWRKQGEEGKIRFVELCEERVAEGQYFCDEQRLAYDMPWSVYRVQGDFYAPYYRIYINNVLMKVCEHEKGCYEFLKTLTFEQAHIANMKNGGK